MGQGVTLSGLFKAVPPPDDFRVRIDDNYPATDEPDLHRWRAWWDRRYDGEVVGIELRPYPVVRKTPTGAWIDPIAWRETVWNGERAVWQWAKPYRPHKTRWIGDNSGASWAKPTKQLAIDSLIYRYQRWASRLSRDLRYFMDCGHVLRYIYPEHARMARERMEMVQDSAVSWPEEK